MKGKVWWRGGRCRLRESTIVVTGLGKIQYMVLEIAFMAVEVLEDELHRLPRQPVCLSKGDEEQ